MAVLSRLHTAGVIEPYENTLEKPYAFEAERRHRMALPLPLANTPVGLTPTQRAFEWLLLLMEDSTVRPFTRVDWDTLTHSDGPATPVFVFDVFDRPVYVLLNEDDTVVQLQAPVLTGLEEDEEAPVLERLERFVSDLGFVVVPGAERTLVACQQLSVEAFAPDALPLFLSFCNHVREATAYVRDHRTRGVPETVPPEVLVHFSLVR